MHIAGKAPGRGRGPSQYPTAIAWTPDGRMLVTEKRGRLLVYDGRGRPTRALGLMGQTCNNGTRGLLSVEVDPNFKRNHFIYVYWTKEGSHGGCSASGLRTGSPQHQVHRYVLRANDRVAKRTKKVIVDHIPATYLQHNAGDLEFGADGYLYVSVGDERCRLTNIGICDRRNNNAQRRDLPHGKVLRVNRNGRPASSNPYVDSPKARRCTKPGKASRGDGPCKEIFARGFRNPFRLAQQPNTNRIYVNDVGLYHWEEIDRLKARKNYGWPIREGHCATGSSTRCGPTRFKNPIHDYPHSSCVSITGGAFVPEVASRGMAAPTDRPLPVRGLGVRDDLPSQGPPGWRHSHARFMRNAQSVVHLEFGPFRSGKALY